MATMLAEETEEEQAEAIFWQAALRVLARKAESTKAGNPVELEWVDLEANWTNWLRELFGGYVHAGFAPHQHDFWDWVWAMERNTQPRPFVAIWPRGAAKSTSTELACVMLGARHRRRYVLYISATQEQADDHVQNIAGMLESVSFGVKYPELANRMLGKYGNSKGWRRNRLRTASGFTVDAIGLDTAARGTKLEEDRPDLLIFDDLDADHDSIGVVERKLTTVTRKLIPAGSGDVAVLAVQNLIHADGIFARLADGRADFLADRILSGPIPAITNLAYEQRDGRYIIVSGEPTWAGMGLERCQAMIDHMGLSAFLSECQHDCEAPPGGIFDKVDFRHCEWKDVPDLTRIVVWVDPAVTDTDESDSHGIQADGITEDGTLYRLWSWEGRTSPEDSLRRAIRKAVELKAECVGVETDQGGDVWEPAYKQAWQKEVEEPWRRDVLLPWQEAHSRPLPPPVDPKRIVPEQPPKPPPMMPFTSAKAGQGHGPKVHRAQQMLVDYERAQIVHVIGTHLTLERALKRFPKKKPFDLTDAAYWSWWDLTRELPEVRIRWL